MIAENAVVSSEESQGAIPATADVVTHSGADANSGGDARGRQESSRARRPWVLSGVQQVRHSLHALVHTVLMHGALADEALFMGLAGRLHRWQREVLPAVAAVARRSMLHGGEPEGWSAIPGVPVSALEERVPGGRLEPSWVDVQQALGPQGCQASWLEDAALTQHLRLRVFPDGVACRLIGLARAPVDPLPRTLAWSLWVIEQSFGRGQAEWLADPAGVDPARLLRALELASLGGEPTLLIGSGAGLIQALAALEAVGQTLPLAIGSRLLLVERVGGMLLADGIRDAVYARLGIPPSHVVCMLERACYPGRLFTDSLSAWVDGREPARGWCLPPWMRACTLDPETQLPQPCGTPGMLLTVNLASVDRPIALVGDDVALVMDDQSLHFFASASDEAWGEGSGEGTGEGTARCLWAQPPVHWAYELNLGEGSIPPTRGEGTSASSSPGSVDKEGYGTYPQVLVAAPRLVV